MTTTEFLFPRPKTIHEGECPVRLPKSMALTGQPIPSWLNDRLAAACRVAGIRLNPIARGKIFLAITCMDSMSRRESAIRAQSYRLDIASNGSVEISAPDVAGLQHGVITFCQLIEASGRGAALSALTIDDSPAFRVRGIQIDMARDFYPPMTYLKRIVDRLVDLKMNTLWLYLENHFRAPGMEDISPKAGLTPEQAREISAYAAERGVDVVPGTNLLSHMEGWFRLERLSDFCDGSGRSHPVLTHREAWPLVRNYVDELAKAFPSRNFNAGLDELLFTGTNPEAAAAIAHMGKARYFAQFAGRIVRHLVSRGKVVWYWDDMVVGKNVNRPEGFGKDAPIALNAIPVKNTVLVHWWYWLNTVDGVKNHSALIRKIGRLGRPFVVAPSSRSFAWNYGSLRSAAENQCYLARQGLKNGAFGYVCTHWESREGHDFEAAWPLLAMSAGQAWSGGAEVDDKFLRALSFAVGGETSGATGRYLKAMDEIEDAVCSGQPSGPSLRTDLIYYGAFRVWRRLSASLSPMERDHLRERIAAAERCRRQMGERDAGLRAAMSYPPVLFTLTLALLDKMDQAWVEYHRAAEVERSPGRRREFNLRIGNAIRSIRKAAGAMGKIAQALRERELTGHTPYDAYALECHRRALLEHVVPLIRAVVRERNGLPFFDHLFYAPDGFFISNPLQFRARNGFFPRHRDLPWPVRPLPVGRQRKGR